MVERSRRTALLAMVAGPTSLAACASAQGAAPGGANQSMASVLERLDRTESRFAIEETLYAYARACDRGDEALMRSCFWPESQHKHGRYEGTSLGFVDFSFNIIRSLKFAAHHISNVSVDVRGDRGFSECHYLAHHRRTAASGQEEDAFFEGRYLDFHERRSGVWKIIRRRGLSDFTSAAVPANTPYANWPAGAHSEKAPTDEYYAMRDAFLQGADR